VVNVLSPEEMFMLELSSSVADELWPCVPVGAPQPPVRSLHLLVVDSHPVVQHGVRLFVGATDRIRAVEQATSGQEGVDVARRVRPDVVLLNPWLGDMLLGDVVGLIGAVSPGTRIVIFAAQVSPSLREEAALLGVSGVLGQDAGRERLLDVITRVAAGEVVTDPGNEGMLKQAAYKLHGTPLTPREHEILRRAARGESNVEIAGAIYLAPTTVKSYLQSALRKLGARNRVEAVFKLSELRIL
jgi:two-component system nitrate/nitrite response regulator NarL